ncbi:MAG: PQQ-binding-like beta-propeller repeat protein [Lentisphaerae bacterium]|nr:PQQ-binding-like beta-propeller repeat protein [Lentisphaerota bacterium]MBT4823465.1 PQQ-binding-like beta-propeller repeat protein [Lentisphaerota bacterium]MBT5605851.1 PQQ-binding-like beta-propeller repeat protein [Lentisphaerota bacterium]MBT7055940.1 PQQ-binding-like beta-propeller repeat protein [Lentisphaerota bacterium]MBT7841567.1 PQQ-binding-like beta-propeller repeat protein [Lentisphaerota bacterium]
MIFPQKQLIACSVALFAACAAWCAPIHVDDLLASTPFRGGVVLIDDPQAIALARDIRTRAPSALIHILVATAAQAGDTNRACAQLPSVSAVTRTAADLPYKARVVNLAVFGTEAPLPSLPELVRVLVPGGWVYVADEDAALPDAATEAVGLQRRTTSGGTLLLRKPELEQDSWTHYLGDAANSAVSGDPTSGPIASLQWQAPPQHARHHDHKGSCSVQNMVSCGRRVYTIADYGAQHSIFLPARYELTVRDAFNGALVWARPLQISNPLASLRGAGYGPKTLAVAGERVYLPMPPRGPLHALDAETGDTVRSFPALTRLEQFIIHGDAVIGVCAERGARADKKLVACDVGTGKVLWQLAESLVGDVSFLTLAARENRVVLQNSRALVCLDAGDGSVVWQHACEQDKRAAVTSGNVVLEQDVVLCTVLAGRKYELRALRLIDGAQLWSQPAAAGWNSYVDVLCIGDTVWVGQQPKRGSPNGQHPHGQQDFTRAFDLHTGKVVQELDTSRAFIDRPHHHRCHRNKATRNQLVLGRHGIELIPTDGSKILIHDWIRGGCNYGIMPANELFYVPPHPCRCYTGNLLSGVLAVAQAPLRDLVKGNPGRTETVQAAPLSGTAPVAGDWPMLRHDPARSGSTPSSVDPNGIGELWRADTGGTPTQAVCVDGVVVAAANRAGTVTARTATTGKPLWQHTASSRIDSPPTIARGRVVLGCADGSVTCLNLRDGNPIWRYLTRSNPEYMVVNDVVESTWPVHGSVLVQDDSVYTMSGRSEHLDGGLCLHRLDLATGRSLQELPLKRVPGEPGVGMPGGVLVADNGMLYNGLHGFKLEAGRAVPLEPVQWPGMCSPRGEAVTAGGRHLIFPRDMLDGSWYHRTSQWVYGRASQIGSVQAAGRNLPCGQILCVDGDRVYGYGRKPEYFMWTSPLEYHLFAAAGDGSKTKLKLSKPQDPRGWLRAPETTFRTHWSVEFPIHVRAMVRTPGYLIVAGPANPLPEGPVEQFPKKSRYTPEQAKTAQEAWDGKHGIKLLFVDVTTGAVARSLDLDALPVFDGISVADGRIYLACKDGSLRCFAGSGTAPRK